MTFWGGTHHALRLLAMDAKEWRYIPYVISLKRRGIDVSYAGLEELGLSEERSKVHSQSGGPDLHAVLKAVGVSSTDSILDLGCGKGGAMLTMAQFPFARIDGVELSPQLAEIARQNFKRAGVINASVICCDAAEFTAFDRYSHVYMYNPFPEQVMQKTLEHILASFAGTGRTLTLIYRHPVDDELLRNTGFIRTREFRYQILNFPAGHAADRTFAIYKVPA